MFSFDIDLMRLFVRLALLACFTYVLAACHRPIAYVQPIPHGPAARLFLAKPTPAALVQPDSSLSEIEPLAVPSPLQEPAVASLANRPTANHGVTARIEGRMNRIQSLLTTSASAIDKQPRPKPGRKLKLGNQIREKLGVPLRKELNWWQRISWKLKASVIVIGVALLFAILHVTILAIIFGILGAFLLITGLKKSMKVRRPWF
ncbi:MAG: hypothetical protein JWP57_3775 [Spirosoma sp.]|nr:hypothetical protein [Spirosoma sp.]